LDFLGEGVGRPGGVDEHDTGGVFQGELEVAGADGVEEFLGLAFDAVERAFPGVDALQRGFAVEVEQEGHIGQATADGEGVDAGGLVGRDAAGDALVNRGGIEKAVADHDAAGFERGQDFFADELGAAGGEEEEFGLGDEVFALGCVLEEVADGFAGGRSPGLADEEGVAAGGAQGGGEQGNLGGFPAAFGTFESDEKAGAGHGANLIFAPIPFSKARMNHWMVKQEPSAYPWGQFERDGGTAWTGVRNFQARNNLRAMRRGDRVLYYHSVEGKCVVGVAEVAREAYPDPTAQEGDWSCVDLKPAGALKRPVGLEEIKAEPELAGVALLRQSRLSVMPLAKAEFDAILRLSKK